MNTITSTFWLILSTIFLIALLPSCKDTQNQNRELIEMKDNMPPLTEEVGNAIQKLNKHRILFAHHSVGENILDGLREIARESRDEISITKIDTTPVPPNSTFTEFSPGQNTHPKSKIDGFTEKIDQLAPDYEPEVAFLKFCYIDFTPDTDIEDLLTYYKKNIDVLKEKRPGTAFVHFTIPLTRRPTDFKSKIKRLLGMQVWGDASNVSRGKFNELLYKAFPDDPIFDLARTESTRPDGSRADFTQNGKVYYSLAQEYTSDGGHLNTLGKRIAAEKFALFIADIFETKQTQAKPNLRISRRT